MFIVLRLKIRVKSSQRPNKITPQWRVTNSVPDNDHKNYTHDYPG